MGFQIDNARRTQSTLLMKTCARCKENQSISNFIPTKSWFYPDGYLPVCADCIKNHLAANNFNWVVVEKVCQYSDIPFVPREFERLRELNGDDVFPTYAAVFLEKEFEGLGWGDYFRKFKELKEQKKSFRFIVARTTPNGSRTWDTNLLVALEDMTLSESADEGDDVIISFTLKQFKAYGVKTINLPTK